LQDSHASLDQAAMVAERLRACVAALPFDHLRDGLRVTISLGVAQWHMGDEGLDAVTRRADEALYRAKDGGRDRVETERDEATAG